MPPLTVKEGIARILERRPLGGRNQHLIRSYISRNGLETHCMVGDSSLSSLLWSTFISDYLRCGKPSDALEIFREMQEHGSTHYLDSFCLLELLKACIEQKDLDLGNQLHQHILERGLLQTDPFLQCTLVDMYAKCGSMDKASNIIGTLPVKDVVLWTALINGYVEQDQGEEALSCLAKMQQEGFTPDAYTFSVGLKACSSAGAPEMGQELHSAVVLIGVERNIVVSCSLIDMYAKNNFIEEAFRVFEVLNNKSIVSWNALLSGLTLHRCSQKALECFHQLQHEANSPDLVTLTCVLQACGHLGSSSSGKAVHTLIVNKGADKDPTVGNTLVDMYAKCGSLVEAQAVFNYLPNQSVVSWNVLIGGYVEYEHGNEALSCFKQMQCLNISPNHITFLHALKAFGDIEAGDQVHSLHTEVLKRGYEVNLNVSNTLIGICAKNGLLVEARNLFDRLLHKDKVSWAILILASLEYDCQEEASSLIAQMQHENLSFEETEYTSCLRMCASLGDVGNGRKFHRQILQKGFEKDFFLANSVLGMYINCGLYVEAYDTLDNLQVRTPCLWNTLIKGCVDLELNEESVFYFELMQYEGLAPDSATYICCLQACSTLGLVCKGQQMHIEIVKKGLEENAKIVCTIIDAYSKWGLLLDAHLVLLKSPVKSGFSWTVLMTGLVDFGYAKDVFECWRNLQCEGILPDVVMYTCGLRASAKLGALAKGMNLHLEIVKRGLEQDCTVGTTLILMYCKCHALSEGQDVFDHLDIQTGITWSVLIAGNLENGNDHVVLNCLDQMHKLGLCLDNTTLASGLKACSSGESISTAHSLCNQIFLRGMEMDSIIYISLVDMYAKCGFLLEAQTAFDKLSDLDDDLWSVLMNGYADAGESGKVLGVLNERLSKGSSPDIVTFLSLLKACTHTGLVDAGEKNFQCMMNFDLRPNLEHWGCIIDLFSRAGNIPKAAMIANAMPFHPSIVVWQTLMGGCRKCKSIDFGKLLFEHLLELDENDSAAYVFISNIHVECWQWDLLMQEEKHYGW